MASEPDRYRVATRLALRRQAGASMVEFAIMLPLLVMLLVGVIYFGYVYVLQSAATHAAQAAVAAVVQVPPVEYDADEYRSAVEDAAAVAIFDSLRWLPDSIMADAGADEFACGENGGVGAVSCQSQWNGSLLTITVLIEVAGDSSALLPRVSIPPFGTVPPAALSNLSGVAQVRL